MDVSTAHDVCDKTIIKKQTTFSSFDSVSEGQMFRCFWVFVAFLFGVKGFLLPGRVNGILEPPALQS